ncbi:unnamed protein product [Hydatigera taeniaeformis]|uniref:Uncharacterized protein n=1 Tax=Hydatigena taeniaeformis TaxID=6205 RepID=A0A0R3WPD1_HYDTA|nr:unnamed protein product [Hydatigera taeniaeformis]
MSSAERHFVGDLDTMDVCRGIGSRQDSGFSDIIARSSTIGEVSDTSLQDSLLQSSPIGFRSPIPRSPNQQEVSRLWRPLHRLPDLQQFASRGAMPINPNRSFRPRSAPLAIDRFSLPEEDEDQDREQTDDEATDHEHHHHQQHHHHHHHQQLINHRDHSPPPPVVFIPRDRRRAGGTRLHNTLIGLIFFITRHDHLQGFCHNHIMCCGTFSSSNNVVDQIHSPFLTL